MPDFNAFEGRLLPHESILWSGAPATGLLLTPRDGLLIPFSLVWCGFTVFWEASVLRSNAPPFMAVFGAAFVLVGAFLVFGRFLVDAWLRGATVYALTDRRVLILRTGPWPAFNALSLDRLPEAGLSEGAYGRGTIRFGPQLPMFSRGYGGFSAWTPALDPTPQFLSIADARRVFEMIQERTNRDDR
jgi:hypothetical protein